MDTIAKSALSSGEVGTLWMTYQIKSLMGQMIKRFAYESQDKKAKKIPMAFLPFIESFHKKIPVNMGITV